MRKYISALWGLLALTLLFSCSNNKQAEESVLSSTESQIISESEDYSSESETSENYIINNKKYLPTQYYSYIDADELYKVLSENKIDVDMIDEINNAQNLSEWHETYTKYKEIWKDELSYSVEILCSFLTSEDADILRNNISEWEGIMLEQQEIQVKMFSNSDYGQHPTGSSLSYIFEENLIKEYRNKTFDIKYYTFILEVNNANNSNDYTPISLKFSWDE